MLKFLISFTVCNEWFHDLGQEFKRPCVNPPVGDKYNYLGFIQ